MRFTVKGSELRSVFRDIGGIFRGYASARVIGVAVTNMELIFTVDTGLYYTRSIPITPVEDVTVINVTVFYSDIASFIDAKSTVLIEMTELYMLLITGSMSVTLTYGVSVISRYVPRVNVTRHDIVAGDLVRTQRVFSKTSDIQKVFNREYGISFYPDYAIMKTPTLWVETKSIGLQFTVSYGHLRNIVAFMPDCVDVSDRLEFRKNNSILSLPATIPEVQSHIGDYLNSMKQISTMTLGGVVNDLSMFKKVAGAVHAVIRIHESGFSVSVNKDNVSIEKKFNATGRNVFTFKCMLDIFTSIVDIFDENDTLSVYWKEGLLCLKNQDTSILLSVQSYNL